MARAFRANARPDLELAPASEVDRDRHAISEARREVDVVVRERVGRHVTDDGRTARAIRSVATQATWAASSEGSNTAFVTVTISGGVASSKGEDPERLVRDADAALYEAKQSDRNRVVTASPA